MDSLVILILAVAILALIAAVFVLGGKGAASYPVASKPLMTKREREAFTIIEQALPNHRVYPQVSMGAILKVKDGLGKSQRTSVRNRFAQKIVDFVVEDRQTGEIAFLLEVDDRTHNAKKDASRDALTAAAGYRTIRIPAGAKLNVAVVREFCSAGMAPAL